MTNSGLDDTPEVQRLDACFDVVENFALASRPVGDYHPLVVRIGALTSQADPIKCTGNIGNIKVDLLNAGRLAQKIVADYHPDLFKPC